MIWNKFFSDVDQNLRPGDVVEYIGEEGRTGVMTSVTPKGARVKWNDLSYQS